MPSVISGDANVSATEFGYLDGVTSALQSQLDSKLPIAGGKILQIVRATDSTARSTTSTSFVDASLSVTISPTKNDSAIVLLANFQSVSPGITYSVYQITDSSNNAISGAEARTSGVNTGVELRTTMSLLGYSTPATTSATTYKVRFKSDGGGTVQLANASNTASFYAIEVSA